eukprot:4907469-Pyramimonas_sp.AAC.1
MELWKTFWRVAQDIGVDEIEFEWIPSHTSRNKAIDQGINMTYWNGNRSADYYARVGADGHPRERPSEK